MARPLAHLALQSMYLCCLLQVELVDAVHFCLAPLQRQVQLIMSACMRRRTILSARRCLLLVHAAWWMRSWACRPFALPVQQLLQGLLPLVAARKLLVQLCLSL